jgi:hypothetical protein
MSSTGVYNPKSSRGADKVTFYGIWADRLATFDMMANSFQNNFAGPIFYEP